MIILLLLVCTLSAWYMTGVIWTVQRVHYALFSQVGKDGWKTYPAGHTRRMTGVTLGPMIVELASAGWLALRPGALAGQRTLLDAGFGFALSTWATTFFVSVPLHNCLSRGFDPNTIQGLVMTNWVRTAALTGHALIMFWALWERLRPG